MIPQGALNYNLARIRAISGYIVETPHRRARKPRGPISPILENFLQGS
jgi:hypothetical protein